MKKIDNFKLENFDNGIAFSRNFKKISGQTSILTLNYS